MTLAGPRAWTVDEVITLCEKYADSQADVSPLRPHTGVCHVVCITDKRAPLMLALVYTASTGAVYMSFVTGCILLYCAYTCCSCPQVMADLFIILTQVTRVPVWLLKSTRNILKSFQWARDAADRLVSLAFFGFADVDLAHMF